MLENDQIADYLLWDFSFFMTKYQFFDFNEVEFLQFELSDEQQRLLKQNHNSGEKIIFTGDIAADKQTVVDYCCLGRRQIKCTH